MLILLCNELDVYVNCIGAAKNRTVLNCIGACCHMRETAYPAILWMAL